MNPANKPHIQECIDSARLGINPQTGLYEMNYSLLHSYLLTMERFDMVDWMYNKLRKNLIRLVQTTFLDYELYPNNAKIQERKQIIEANNRIIENAQRRVTELNARIRGMKIGNILNENIRRIKESGTEIMMIPYTPHFPEFSRKLHKKDVTDQDILDISRRFNISLR
jgi:hypothetical protein